VDVKAFEGFRVEVRGGLRLDRVMDVDVGGGVDVERKLANVAFGEREAAARGEERLERAPGEEANERSLMRFHLSPRSCGMRSDTQEILGIECESSELLEVRDGPEKRQITEIVRLVASTNV